jgi:hypothetical protein
VRVECQAWMFHACNPNYSGDGDRRITI